LSCTASWATISPFLTRKMCACSVAGDVEPLPLAARSEIRALLDDPVPTQKLDRYAGLSRQLYERVGPLARVLRAGAAAGDDDLVQLLATVERERLRGTSRIAAHLAEVGALRPGLTVARAGQRLWVINAGETGDALVVGCGWSLDEYEGWMAESMTFALLRS
jgi:hypothetical protein